MNQFVLQHCYYVLVIFALLVPRAAAATIPTVPVGNPGNPADTRYDAIGFGSVDYHYRIGTTEVTNAQYVEFLNEVDPAGTNTLALYDSDMSSDALGGINFNSGAQNGSKYETKAGRDNNPVVSVSWYDAIRFANWLHNGQGNGDTESGAYTLGALGGDGIPINGDSIMRNSGARWWLPNEDEWYKAAYHKNDGATGNYWDYPTSTDEVPFSDQPPGSDAPTQSNTANFFKDDGLINAYDDGFAATGSAAVVRSQNYLTDVGAYTLSASPYGTFDQGGNVWEWNEASISNFMFDGRGFRGASWANFAINLRPLDQRASEPANQSLLIGFRVATIPEPSTIVLFGLGFLLLGHRINRVAQPG